MTEDTVIEIAFRFLRSTMFNDVADWPALPFTTIEKPELPDTKNSSATVRILRRIFVVDRIVTFAENV
jgi:hypothetical protein